VHAQPKIVRVRVSRPENFFALWRAGIHALAASRAGADQNEAANEIRRLQRDFLRH
jgi:hypothetical protein